MKTKLKLMLVGVLGMMFLHTQAHKDGENHGRKHKHARMDSMALRYNLTEKQKTDLKVRFKSLKGKKEKPAAAATKAEKQAIHRQKNAQRDSIIETVFTSTQYAQYQADLKQRKASHKGKKQGDRAAQLADSMTRKYALNATQSAAVKQAYTTFFTNVKTARMANEDNADKTAMKTAVKAERKNLDAKMKGILSHANYKDWKAEMKSRKRKK